MSDLPCEQQASNSIIKVAQTKVKTASSSTDDKTTAITTPTRDSLEDRILAGHNPECKALRQNISQQGAIKDGIINVPTKADTGLQSAWGRYQALCLTQAKDITVLYTAQKEGEKREAARKAACEIKTREYKNRSLTKSSMTEAQLDNLAILGAEVARGCR